jgi:hypothetical protein
MSEDESKNGSYPLETNVSDVRDGRKAELQMTGHAPVATQFAGWGATLPADAQGEQAAISNGDQTPLLQQTDNPASEE